MANETKRRKPKAISDLIDSEIMDLRDQIVLENNSKLNNFLF
jgi:hypothetical protein